MCYVTHSYNALHASKLLIDDIINSQSFNDNSFVRSWQ